MPVLGVGVSGFRSYGPEMQFLGPLARTSVIVGPNNSGKSNCVSFIAELLPRIIEQLGQSNPQLRLDPQDSHIGEPVGLAFALPIGNDATSIEVLTQRIFGEASESPAVQQIKERLAPLLTHPTITASDDSLGWIRFEIDEDGRFQIDRKWLDEILSAAIMSSAKWNGIHSRMFSRKGSSPSPGIATGHTIGAILQRLVQAAHNMVPEVHVVPAIRQVTDSEMLDLGGGGLVQRLAALQNPGFTDRHLKQRFSAINAFVQRVLGEEDAELEVVDGYSALLVSMRGLELPIERLGTGVAETIILAAAAVTIDDAVICIEEPEVHLHPAIQRQLVEFLQNETRNQYIFTTHSAHVLDSPGAAIVQVSRTSTSSSLSVIRSDDDRVGLCRALGYRPSDLLQSNCVVWVEGPSDVIYLQRWLELVDPSLVEGFHYSIMFYGGKLLSHLTAESVDRDHDLIGLLRLNQHPAILIDSDKRAASDPINATKQRIQTEFESGDRFCWVTAGREVENYLRHELIIEFMTARSPEAQALAPTDEFDHALAFQIPAKDTSYEVPKVALAEFVAARTVSLDVLDLETRVRGLVDYIRGASA